jgi:2-dehydropantoate 2-reductase
VRVLVYGAGVVGQIYGGRLAGAGHQVTLLARGSALERLAACGVALDAGAGASRAHPAVTGDVHRDEPYDVVLVTVRRDQLYDALPVIAELTAARVVLMLNHSLELERVRRRVGAARTVFAFPGVGGHRTDDGTIRYLEVPQQKTTVERRGGSEQLVVDLLHSARFPVEVTPDVEGWLKTHAVFIAGVSAAILACGGDSAALAADSGRVGTMVAAVGEGFRALARGGVAVTPRPLRIVFTRAPRFVAVRYWRAQLRGPVGTVAIAPHVRATRDSELPVLCADVRRLIDGGGPTPHLSGLLDAVAAATGPTAHDPRPREGRS